MPVERDLEFERRVFDGGIDAIVIFGYAKNILKHRWPEAEPAIVRHSTFAYRYAKNILKDRWPEAEPAIMKNPNLLYHYIEMFVKKRWPEMEPSLQKDPTIWRMYIEELLEPLGQDIDVWDTELW